MKQKTPDSFKKTCRNADCHLTLRQGSPKYNKEKTTEADEATRHG